MVENLDLLEIDWITAKMYGKELNKRKNSFPMSKNGIEPLENIDHEFKEMLDLIDEKLFLSPKERPWDEEYFR